jgi:hypothetical protein
MGAQEDRLAEVLHTQLGFTEADKPPRPKLTAMPPDARKQVIDLYRALGGIHPDPPLTTGSWDSAYAGNLMVELDESAHFNRYRVTTLEPAWAQHLPWHGAYAEFSVQFEDVCLKERGWGGYWTNTSTERLFGPPGPQRSLDGAGSPRWKQRALYDAMRDIAALHGIVRLVRLSVYDELGGAPLGRALSGKAPLDTESLRALIVERTFG